MIPLEQKNTKLTYIALVVSVGALVVCGATAALSAFPNSGNISKLQQQVQQHNDLLSSQSVSGRDSRSRIDELDFGLTAIAHIAKIDPATLSKAIADVRAAEAKSKGLSNAPAVQQAWPATPGPAATATESDQPTSGPAPASEPAKTSTPQPDPDDGQARERAIVNSKPTNSENPFTAESEHAGGAVEEAPAPLSIASVKAASGPTMSVAQVDTILAKRLVSSWYTPAGSKDNLNAVIQVQINRDGKVGEVKVVTPSGDERFDISAVSALKSLEPISEVARLSDADYKKAYASRSIRFTPKMGG
ncbi:TonB family protein [Pseudomonas syringae]|nr:TonB family protein [Pseudomonas syringae]